MTNSNTAAKGGFRRGIKKVLRSQEFAVLIPLVLLCLATYFANNNFATRQNLTGIITGITTNAYLAIGMTLVMICGDIDISIGPLMGLGMMVTFVLIIQKGWAFFPAYLVALVIAVVVGIMKGLLVTKLALPPFIATIGFNFICKGLKYFITRGQYLYPMPQYLQDFASLRPLGTTWSFLIAVITFAVFIFIMTKTSFGRKMYAAGDNREVAKLSGINVDFMRTAAFVILGVLCVSAGILQAIFTKSADPKTGDTSEMYAIAASAVGGISFNGGRGSLLGTAIGVVFIAVVNNALVMFGVDANLQTSVVGILLIIAVLFDAIRSKGKITAEA